MIIWIIDSQIHSVCSNPGSFSSLYMSATSSQEENTEFAKDLRLNRACIEGARSRSIHPYRNIAHQSVHALLFHRVWSWKLTEPIRCSHSSALAVFKHTEGRQGLPYARVYNGPQTLTSGPRVRYFSIRDIAVARVCAITRFRLHAQPWHLVAVVSGGGFYLSRVSTKRSTHTSVHPF